MLVSPLYLALFSKRQQLVLNDEEQMQDGILPLLLHMDHRLLYLVSVYQLKKGCQIMEIRGKLLFLFLFLFQRLTTKLSVVCRVTGINEYSFFSSTSNIFTTVAELLELIQGIFPASSV